MPKATLLRGHNGHLNKFLLQRCKSQVGVSHRSHCRSDQAPVFTKNTRSMRKSKNKPRVSDVDEQQPKRVHDDQDKVDKMK